MLQESIELENEIEDSGETLIGVSTGRQNLQVSFTLTSYIAEPFWPELSEVIGIQKLISPKLGEEKKVAALKAILEKKGLTMADYANLQERAARKWYRNDDGAIIIPRHQIAGALVQTVKNAPAAIRGKFHKDSFRNYVRVSDFLTNKKEKDELFDRYVSNFPKTNERRRTISEVVTNVACQGVVSLADIYKVEDFERIMRVSISDVGIGACRKMGYGRGHDLQIKVT